MSSSSSKRIRPKESVSLWICDLQEKFAGAVTGFDHCAHNSATLVRAVSAMGTNHAVYVTEQVPEKLGSTVSVVREATEASRCATSYAGKTKFSMHADDASKMKGMLDECDHVCVMGIEAHVCVLQTVLDLLEAGKSVHVCVDATSSIRLEDRAVALRRMENAGAVLTCTESVIFEMLGDASDEAFRDVSKIVREGAKNKPTSPPLPSL
jgi:hypothetical protein